MKKRLRVLSISTLYPNDVTPNFGVFVERQMQAVTRRDEVDLTVLNPIGLPPFPLSLHPRYAALRKLSLADMRGGVYILRPRFRLLPAIGGRFNARMVARAIIPTFQQIHADNPYDVIDAQFFYPDGPAAVALGKALGLPVSIKARGADIHHWGTAPGTAEQVISAGRAAQGLLAVSTGMAADMTALGLPRERITVHRTGLDRTVFRPLDKAEARRKLGLPLDVPVLATVGALISRKGQTHAIAALSRLPDAHLVLAGAGPDEASLREQAASLGVAGRVHFLGPVPHGQLPEVYSAADISVLPTASEGLANAWVEALACGTPVVTTDIPGARELITAPEHGRLVARDGTAIAQAVSALLADLPSPDRVQQAAADYSWETNAAQLVNHWRQLALAI